MNRCWNSSIKIKLLALALGLLAGFGIWNTVSRGGQIAEAGNISVGTSSAPALQGRPAIDYLKQRGLYGRVRASVEASRYEIGWRERTGLAGLKKAYQAVNPAQNLRAYFSPQGVRITPREANARPSWQFGMKLRGAGYGERLSEVIAGPMIADGNRIEIKQSAIRNPQSAITEWYVNKSEGIEQGFTLSERPGETFGGEPLRLAMELSGDLKASLADDGQAVSLSSRRGKEALRYDHLTAYDALGRILPSRMEVREREVSLLVEDAHAVYPVTIDPLFTQIKKLTASDGVQDDNLGFAVSVDGDTAIIGAYGDDGFQGSAYIFQRNNGGADNWGQVKKIIASDPAAGEEFGRAVAISGDTIVVGADGDNNFAGAAYIFQRNNGGAGNWGEVKKIIASDNSGPDLFGISVTISGDTVVVGASNKDGARGQAYVYQRNLGGADNWGEVRKLLATDGEANDNFGISVAVSGSTVVAGAYGDDSGKGSAWIFQKDNGGADNWGWVKKLSVSGGSAFESFGISVAVSNDTVAVGESGANINRGAAYIFQKNNGGPDNWGLVKKLLASDGAANDYLGISVAVSGDTVVTGAYGDSDQGPESGSAYVFERNQGGADNWGQTNKLTASDGHQFYNFGYSVAVSGAVITIGAPGDATRKGSAYIFASQQINSPPTISAAGANRTEGSSAVFSAIANVSDLDQGPSTLAVTVNGSSSATVNNVTVNNISVNGAGSVTASIVADCGASDASFTLTVTDSQNATASATLIVSVSPNPAPTLGAYPSTGPVALGSNLTVTPNAAPGDNGSVVSLTASAPGFGGTFSGNPGTGEVSITNASPSGTYTVTAKATDNCGAITTMAFTLIVNTAPAITSTATSRQQGAAASVSQIATVSDPNQAADTLTVKVNGSPSATVNGVTVKSINVDSSGKVTASVAASCSATNATFALTAGDSLGATGGASLVVNVTAGNAPVITLRSPITFWLPLHNYRTLTVSDMVYSASDDCDGRLTSSVVIEKVTSDEPDNISGDPSDGLTVKDIVIASDCKSVRLRAERDWDKDGRVYKVTLRVKDSSGNITRAVFKVTVPIFFEYPAVDSGVAFTVNSNCQ